MILTATLAPSKTIAAPVEEEPIYEWINYEEIATEDDEPVDNIFSEKQQRLLTEPLYNSWAGPDGNKLFLALANVGLFYALREPPIVPDVMLSVDVEAPKDLWKKPNRSYFIWEYGKPPDVVIEIVSNKKGGEDERKFRQYAQMGTDHYVIFDPSKQLSNEVISTYSKERGLYEQNKTHLFRNIGLGVTLWKGVYEEMEQTWLRWCDLEGNLIPTGAEQIEQKERQIEQKERQVEQERLRAEQERLRAEQERLRAQEAQKGLFEERERVKRLMAQLRALGIEPQDE